MKMKHFVNRLDHAKIIKAIKEAEQKTSGPVRLYVSHRAVKDPIKAARWALARLGIHKHPDQNGVVIFVAPEAQKFAVIGDKRIHEKLKDEFWVQVVALIGEHFKTGEFTVGIVSAIAKVGQASEQLNKTAPT